MNELQTDDNYWSHYTQDDFKTMLDWLGFINIRLAWCGFWSQGDGASFTGTWRQDFCKFEKYVENVDERDKTWSIVARLRALLTEVRLVLGEEMSRCTISHGHSNYCHENTVTFEFFSGDDIDRSDYEKRFSEICRDLMRYFYRQLEEEHDYITSRSQLREHAIANEYRFNMEGEII